MTLRILDMWKANRSYYDLEMKGELERLRAALTRWQEETNDAFPGEDELTPDGFDRETGDRMINSSHPDLVKPQKQRKPRKQ